MKHALMTLLMLYRDCCVNSRILCHACML